AHACSRDVAGHRLVPHRVLQGVEARDLGFPKLRDVLGLLAGKGLLDGAIGSSGVGVAQLRCDLAVCAALHRQLNSLGSPVCRKLLVAMRTAMSTVNLSY